MKLHEKVSTGMTGFDKTIDMLRMGDNVVWQIDCIEDYQKPFDFPAPLNSDKGRNNVLIFCRFILWGKDIMSFNLPDNCQAMNIVRGDRTHFFDLLGLYCLLFGISGSFFVHIFIASLPIYSLA